MPDSKKRARVELVDLTESQLDTLEKETFACVQEQNSANTRRRDHIFQLSAELIDRKAAA